MSNITGNVSIDGHLSATSMTVPSASIDQNSFKPETAIPRSLLAQQVLKPLVIPHTAWRIFDDLTAPLTDTPGTDDLGLIPGTFGTSTPTIQTGDLKSAGSTTRKARLLLPIPGDYDSNKTILLSFRAGMIGDAADNAATLDVQVFKSDQEGGLGSDLYTGSAIDVNFTALDDYDFDLGATLSAGDWLDILISFLVNDAATGTEVSGVIGDARLRYDAR